MFCRRSREQGAYTSQFGFSLTASPLASRGGSAPRKYPGHKNPPVTQANDDDDGAAAAAADDDDDGEPDVDNMMAITLMTR